MSKVCLVTGAAGFIGSTLSESLLERGDRVIGIDNFEPFYARELKEENLAACRAHPNFTFEEADIRDAPRMAALLEAYRVTNIIHAAAMAGVRPSLERPAYYAEVNVGGTINLLEAARRHPVENFVLFSSSSVYGDRSPVPFREEEPANYPVSPYGATKKMCELAAYTYHHLYGLSLTCIRPFTVYGPRQRPEMAIHQFVRRLHRGEPITMFGDGSMERDFTYIDDLVNGLIGAVDRPLAYEIINLGESQTIKLRELIALLGRVCGIAPKIEQRPLQSGDVRRTYADISKARRLLDYSPQTNLQTGLARFVEWYRQYRLERDLAQP